MFFSVNPNIHGALHKTPARYVLSGFRRFRQAGEKADTFGSYPKNKGELIKRNSPFGKFPAEFFLVLWDKEFRGNTLNWCRRRELNPYERELIGF